MANPQIEHGHIRIASGKPLNDLYTVLIFLVIAKPTWGAIAMYVLRITYGWSSRERETNFQSFATVLGLTKQTIKENMAEMESVGVLKVRIMPMSQERFVVSLCKNYELWKIEGPFKGLLKRFIGV